MSEYGTMELWRAPNLVELDRVVHAFSTRWGGVSPPPFASLNLGYHTGDDGARVTENRRRFLASLGARLDDAICAEQVHSAAVRRVGAPDRGRGAADPHTPVPGVDALATGDAGSLLLLCFADCVPVFLADRRQGAVALAHAGWRGSLAGVVEAAVAEMGRLGVEPAALVAALGPCIKPCCYEVSPELAQRFTARFGPGVARRSRRGAPSIDLAEANRRALEASGVPGASIYVEPECTACRTDRYFSHRAEGGATGRMAAVIGLRGR